MARPTPEALAAAVNALYRIRATETPPGRDGMKTVWHQCAQGADLQSTVNDRGQVVEQELTLLNTYYLWTAEHGLTTGWVVEGGARGAATPLVQHDRVVDEERLGDAYRALSSYSGADRYILHVLEVLRLANEGVREGSKPTTVTGMAKIEAPVPAEGEGRSQAVLMVLAIGAGALAVGLLVARLW